jgi:hypothetical protein
MIRRTSLTKLRNLGRVPSNFSGRLIWGSGATICKGRRYWGKRWWLILQAGHRVSKYDIFLLKVLKGDEDLNEIDV